ncbi:MAG: glycerol-3-phosphate dehydrogenase [Gemmatimonadota bacterium]|nr:glycerol-3-phosphate dehydrogenase [Gemmatimonadota bacterium]
MTNAPHRARRSADLDALAQREFDLVVIGGGITGAGIARDAALRGLSVALLEASDFASGTSSRSSRLIHGGLRYLEHGHLGLVLESSRERRVLLRIAPHLVRPLAFTWPVYSGARVARWRLGAGLVLYDALAGFQNVRNHRRLTVTDVTKLEPALSRDGLRGGARYFDAATDDSRLTLANALAAAAAGGLVLNHVAARDLVMDGDIVRGVVAEDRVSGRQMQVRAAIVVSAAGPWADAVRGLAQVTGAPMVRTSKGVHIAVARSRIGNREALTVLSPVDERVMFILPDGALTIVGTTETEYHGPPEEVRSTEADIAYLLQSANHYFPSARLERADVVSAWAGIRPLVAGGSRDAGTVSREHEISRIAPGLIGITGGKLTTYRTMAAEVVDAAYPRRGTTRVPRSRTDLIPLPGGELDAVDAEIAAATAAIGTEDIATRLVHAHGTAWRDVWALAVADPSLAERVEPSLPYVMAELRYGIEREMAMTLGDLLIRRLRVAFETTDHGMRAAQSAVAIAAPLLEWDPSRQRLELDRYGEEAKRIFGVDAA